MEFLKESLTKISEEIFHKIPDRCSDWTTEGIGEEISGEYNLKRLWKKKTEKMRRKIYEWFSSEYTEKFLETNLGRNSRGISEKKI